MLSLVSSGSAHFVNRISAVTLSPPDHVGHLSDRDKNPILEVDENQKFLEVDAEGGISEAPIFLPEDSANSESRAYDVNVL